MPYHLQWTEVLVLASVLVLILAPRGIIDLGHAIVALLRRFRRAVPRDLTRS